ncbi:hypothetical protein M2317_000505 [Microbacterium sp. ZKA21]
MPRSSPLLTRIAPEFAPLWRDGDTLQFGVAGDVRIRVDRPWVERLVSRLCAGIPLASFDVAAHALGAPRREARDLLDALAPVLQTEDPPAPAAWTESLNIGDSRIGGWMLDALGDLGVPEAARTDRRAVGILLVHGSAAACQVNAYQREDIVHLPVAFDFGGVSVGPLVVPGETPCLSCRDGHERDRDPAWPLLHCQLVGRTDSPIAHALVAETAGVVERLLRAGSAQSSMVRISADGSRRRTAVKFHAECRCREQSFRSPRGTETPTALLDPLPATRTA